MFAALWKSIQKTLIVMATGVAVPAALALTSSTPTGGFAAYLGSHQAVAGVFGVAALLAHNYLSQIQQVPASQVVSVPVVAPLAVIPPKV